MFSDKGISSVGLVSSTLGTSASGASSVGLVSIVSSTLGTSLVSTIFVYIFTMLLLTMGLVAQALDLMQEAIMPM